MMGARQDGRVYDLPQVNNQVLGTVMAYTPDGEPDTWTVLIQPAMLPSGVGGSAGEIQATIRYAVGDAEFTKQVLCLTTNLTKVQVAASRVSVDLSIVQRTAPAGPAIPVRVGAMLGDVRGADGYAWTWGQAPVTGTDNGQAFVGPGVLGQLHVTLEQTAGAEVWLMVFDATAQPIAGAAPMPGGVSDGMVAVGDSDQFEDEIAPGGVAFSTGLWVGLSTSATNYQPAGAGYQCRVDVKVGQ